MPGDVMAASLQKADPIPSAGLATILAETDFSTASATVIGYGKMGREYVKALRALGVRRIRVCSRNSEVMSDLKGVQGVETFSGGYQELQVRPAQEEVGVLAIPIADLCPASQKLADMGYRRLLIEKPVSLWSREIVRLDQILAQYDLDAAVAYNRVSYPSFLEAKYRTAREGGITSCMYTFTEFIHKIDLKRYSQDELARWGIANSLHVVSMAHALVGLPEAWSGYRSGSLAWHPSGAVFVGSGLSQKGVPFAYQADWGSTGRWSLELHTQISSYRFCPLEQLSRRLSATSRWEEVPVTAFDPQVKTGFVEEVAAMLNERIRFFIPLISLSEAVALTRYGEKLFGYSE